MKELTEEQRINISKIVRFVYGYMVGSRDITVESDEIDKCIESCEIWASNDIYDP